MMVMWTVYDHPSDYPDHYVARKSVIGASTVTPTDELFAAYTLGEVRELLPPGLYRIHRYEQDDPRIVEVWL